MPLGTKRATVHASSHHALRFTTRGILCGGGSCATSITRAMSGGIAAPHTTGRTIWVAARSAPEGRATVAWYAVLPPLLSAPTLAIAVPSASPVPAGSRPRRIF